MGRRDRRERQGPLHSIVGALTAKAGGQDQRRAQSEDGYERGYGSQQNQTQGQHDDGYDRGFGGQRNQSRPQYDDRNDLRDDRGARRDRRGPLHSIVGAITSKAGGQEQPRSQSGPGYDRSYENQQNQMRSQYDNSNQYQNDRGSGSGRRGRQGPIHSIIGAITSKVGEQSQSKPKYSGPNPDNVTHDPRFQGEQLQYEPQYGTSTGNGYDRSFGNEQNTTGTEPGTTFTDDRRFDGDGQSQSSGFIQPDGMPPSYEASRNQPRTDHRNGTGMYEME